MAPFLPTTLRFADLSATPAFQPALPPDAATPCATLAKARPTELWPTRSGEQRMVSSRSYHNALAALLNGSVSTIGSQG